MLLLDETLDLIREAQNGSSEAEAKLLSANSGLIWSIVRRYFGRGTDGDDLYQLGCIGFLKAVRDFNFEFGNRFSTYAVPKISGEIRRFLRDDGTVKVSRSLREIFLRVQNARESLCARLGREPLLSELAEETGLPPEEIAAAEASAAPIEPLYGVSDSAKSPADTIPGEDGMEELVSDRLSLDQALSSLPMEEAGIIRLRYFRNLTQQQTAHLLNMTQVQVSRAEKKILQKLRKSLCG